MRDRLVLLRELLSEDGSLWVSIDDNELHYLKILCDEIFGRSNHIATIVASMNPKGRQLSRYFAGVHEYLLCIAKDISRCLISAQSTEDVDPNDFTLEDERGRHRLLPLRNTNKKFNPTTRPNLYYPVFYDPSTDRISLTAGEGFVEILPEFGDGKPAVWRWGAGQAWPRKHGSSSQAHKTNG
jgi:adenine-specific DNA-methyltransferase